MYKDPKRKVGSQSEIPTLTWNTPKTVAKVGGYQTFTVGNNNFLVYQARYATKFQAIENFISDQVKIQTEKKLLDPHTQPQFSVMDLGCSSGLVCFLAHRAGATEIWGLDHDSQYLKVIKDISQQFGWSNIHTLPYSFGQIFPQKCDLVVAGALIHWVYSCTANFGSLERIVEYLKKGTNRFLLIEWVDPKDPAMKSFKHTNFNKAVQKESYSLTNFVQALEKHFTRVSKFCTSSATRWFYLAEL